MNNLKSERGTIMVLVAIALVVLLGMAAFVVDYGRGVLLHNQLQKASDAAALAGVAELPGSRPSATTKAIAYCAANGVAASDVTVTFPASTTISVEIRHNMDFLFAPILSHDNGVVNARAQAQTGPVGVMAGVVPVGVEKQAFAYGELYTLKYGSGGGGSVYSGNFGALALGGRGASVYESNLKYGYSGTLSVGDWVDSKPGNMKGPTEDGVEYRVEQAPDETYLTFTTGSARLVYVPIIESLEVHGRDEVLITGFAAFFLEVHEDTSKGDITGRFIQYVTAGQISTSAGDYGLRMVHLLQ